MIEQQHPITPAPELVEQWYRDSPEDDEQCYIATQAARWGADQELHALLTWLRVHHYDNLASDLLAARRPQAPLGLAEQALEALDQADKGLNESEWQQRSDTIRRALERLQELENNG